MLCVLGDPDLEMWLVVQLEHSLPPIIMWVGMMVTYLILWSSMTWIGWKHNMLEIVHCVECIWHAESLEAGCISFVGKCNILWHILLDPLVEGWILPHSNGSNGTGYIISLLPDNRRANFRSTVSNVPQMVDNV